MAGLFVKMLKLLLFICSFISSSLTNNIDIKVSPIRKYGIVGSYFGFSVTGVDDTLSWVAVGSPKANSTNILFNNKNVEGTGALYKCSMTMNQSDCSDISKPMLKDIADPTNGWYGVSVAGGKKEEDLLVCSHRLTVKHCNTERQCQFALPGGCKKAVARGSGFGLLAGGLFIINKNNEADFAGKADQPNLQMSSERSRYGQTGIGSIYAPYLNEKFLSGAVGEKSWTGAVAGKNNKFPASTETFSYGGYSLARGDFFTAGETAFAIGAPRYLLAGAVFVQKNLDDITSAILIQGEQYGSYFGMSICASDFNGDRIAEIVVAAPYHTESLKHPGIGAVYVYNKTNNFMKPYHILKSKHPQARALFGRCVAAIGDVDLDGYNDLAVGAPYGEKGGVVYIYHGSKVGLFEQPVQTLRAKDLPFPLQTFGWSIRGEVDLDGNGYADLVIGAYASDSIVILRSLPVVKVTSMYELTPEKIDVTNQTCSISDPDLGNIMTVCFTVEIRASYKDRAKKMTRNIELLFVLDADTMVKDASKKRVRFKQNNANKLEIRKSDVQNERITQVVKAVAYLRTDLCPECKDKIRLFPNIEFKLTPKLPTRDPPPSIPVSGKPPSLEKYFQLPFFITDFQNVTSKTLDIKRECYPDPCRPDLKIVNIGTTTIAVKAENVHLKIKISNNKERAYGVVCKIMLPPKLRAFRCEDGYFQGLKCLYDQCELKYNRTEMICELGSMTGTSEESYAIMLDTTLASQTLDDYRIQMNVSSGNIEEADLLDDNTVELVLKVESTANIGIRSSKSTESRYYGGSVRGQFSMTNEEQIGLAVEHTYVVENKGPDDVPEVNITIEWPYETKSGKNLLYLLEIKKSPKMKCFPHPGWVNPLAKQFKVLTKEVLNETISKRKRRDVGGDEATETSPVVNQQVRKGSSSKVVLDCRNNTAKCHHIRCTVKNINDKDKVGITIKSRIWNGTLLEDYKGQDVEVVSYARVDELTDYVRDNDKKNHEAHISTYFFPSTPKTTKKGIAIWIIVVSAIAGVLLLVLLIFIFKMCGFFKRMDTGQYDAVPSETK